MTFRWGKAKEAKFANLLSAPKNGDPKNLSVATVKVVTQSIFQILNNNSAPLYCGKACNFNIGKPLEGHCVCMAI